jgi:hypothetical protein
MQPLSLPVDDQLVTAAIMLQIALANHRRIAGDQNGPIRSRFVDKPAAYMKWLMHVANEMDQ